MNMPKPTPEHQKLHAFVGTWKGEEKLFPSNWDPTGGPAYGVFTHRMEINGFFLITDYVETRNGQESYRGHGIMGYDANKKVYTWYWVDAMGMPPSHPIEGHWTDKGLLFNESGPKGHFSHGFGLLDPNTSTFRIDTSADGKTWSPMMEGRYVKQ